MKAVWQLAGLLLITPAVLALCGVALVGGCVWIVGELLRIVGDLLVLGGRRGWWLLHRPFRDEPCDCDECKEWG